VRGVGRVSWVQEHNFSFKSYYANDFTSTKRTRAVIFKRMLENLSVMRKANKVGRGCQPKIAITIYCHVPNEIQIA
jgi:hypothetical protein